MSNPNPRLCMNTVLCGKRGNTVAEGIIVANQLAGSGEIILDYLLGPSVITKVLSKVEKGAEEGVS